jgi:hypothetical protein
MAVQGRCNGMANLLEEAAVAHLTQKKIYFFSC